MYFLFIRLRLSILNWLAEMKEVYKKAREEKKKLAEWENKLLNRYVELYGECTHFEEIELVHVAKEMFGDKIYTEDIDHILSVVTNHIYL